MRKYNKGTMHERRADLFDPEDGTFGAFDEGHYWHSDLHGIYQKAQDRLTEMECDDARAIVKAWEAAISFEERGMDEAIPTQMFLIGAAWQRIKTSIVAKRPWTAGKKIIEAGHEGGHRRRIASDEERVEAVSRWLENNPGKSNSAAYRWLDLNAHLGSARTLKRAWEKRN